MRFGFDDVVLAADRGPVLHRLKPKRTARHGGARPPIASNRPEGEVSRRLPDARSRSDSTEQRSTGLEIQSWTQNNFETGAANELPAGLGLGPSRLSARRRTQLLRASTRNQSALFCIPMVARAMHALRLPARERRCSARRAPERD